MKLKDALHCNKVVKCTPTMLEKFKKKRSGKEKKILDTEKNERPNNQI